MMKPRKHVGLNSKNQLKPGFRYSGKKLKSGKPQIVRTKAKKKKRPRAKVQSGGGDKVFTADCAKFKVTCSKKKGCKADKPSCKISKFERNTSQPWFNRAAMTAAALGLSTAAANTLGYFDYEPNDGEFIS